MAPVRIDVRHQSDHVVVVVSGSVTSGPHLERLRDTMAALTKEGHRAFVLRLDDVHLDSAGLGELVRVHALVAGHGGRLSMLGLHERYERLLPVTRVFNPRLDSKPYPAAPQPYEIGWGVRLAVAAAVVIVIMAITMWRLGVF